MLVLCGPAERALARQIAGFPPIAMTSDRQSAYESFDRDQAAAIRREMERCASLIPPSLRTTASAASRSRATSAAIAMRSRRRHAAHE